MLYGKEEVGEDKDMRVKGWWLDSRLCLVESGGGGESTQEG